VWIVSHVKKYNSSQRRHQVGGSLKRVVFQRNDSCYTNRTWDTLAGRVLLLPWEVRKVNREVRKVNSDHPYAKKEVDLVRTSIVQIGQLLQDSLKVNDNGVKWKQLTDRAEADRNTLCKLLDGQALFTGLFRMYAATYKERRDSLQPSSMESGQEVASQAEQNKRRKRGRNSEDKCCTK
jgi:hypothetical protein